MLRIHMPLAWRAEPQFHHLFDAVSDPILVANEAAEYVDANTPASRLLGYSLREFCAMKVSDVVTRPPDWTASEYRRYLAEGHWDGDVELRHKEGHTISVLARARILQLDTGTAYVSVLKLKPDSSGS